MSEAEENKALVRKFYEEAWVKGNEEAVDEFIAADYVEHGLTTGAEGLKRSITAYRTAFPDWKTTLDDIFAEGEMVTCLWSTRGTHLGDWFDIPPTGNHFTATGISVLRIAAGKVVENWTSIDLSPTEEEMRWLTEGGEWPRSGEIPSTERDTSSRPRWEGSLTRTLTWRMRAAEARERERIEQELRVARQIQQKLLPETIPKLDGWQIATYYGPATEVGGDFYDFLELEDGRLGLVLGDATGHGMPAALVMATTRGMLRAVVQSSESPGEVLARVNEALVAEIPPSTFVTCFYGVLDPKNGHFRYSNAGHNLPLGLMPGMSYEEKEAVLETGDSILFYSDGLVEAHDSQGEMFGFPQLRRLVAEHDAEEGSLADFLIEKLYSFVGEGWEQEDDITLVTLQ
jgi:predicted ester cyclase